MRIGHKGLQEHKHSSQNTHLIVEGELRIGYTTNDGPCPKTAKFRFRNVKIMAKGDWLTVACNIDYKSEEAGPKGCEFVEGHKELSPATAERFAERLTWPERPTILKAKEGEPGAFLVEPGRNHKHQPSAVEALSGLVNSMAIEETSKKASKQKKSVRTGTSKDQFLM